MTTIDRSLPLRDRCLDCGKTAPTDDSGKCQDCALRAEGLALGTPEVCRNGWTVQQVHAFGTAEDEQAGLFEDSP